MSYESIQLMVSPSLSQSCNDSHMWSTRPTCLNSTATRCTGINATEKGVDQAQHNLRSFNTFHCSHQHHSLQFNSLHLNYLFIRTSLQRVFIYYKETEGDLCIFFYVMNSHLSGRKEVGSTHKARQDAINLHAFCYVKKQPRVRLSKLRVI